MGRETAGIFDSPRRVARSGEAASTRANRPALMPPGRGAQFVSESSGPHKPFGERERAAETLTR